MGSGVGQVSCGSCVPSAGSSSADTAPLEAALTLRKFFPPWGLPLPPWLPFCEHLWSGKQPLAADWKPVMPAPPENPPAAHP